MFSHSKDATHVCKNSRAVRVNFCCFYRKQCHTNLFLEYNYLSGHSTVLFVVIHDRSDPYLYILGCTCVCVQSSVPHWTTCSLRRRRLDPVRNHSMALVEDELPGVGKGQLSCPTNRTTPILTCKCLLCLFCSEGAVSSSRGLDPRPATPGERMYVIRESQCLSSGVSCLPSRGTW